jgi:hypothetical protein
MKYILDADMLLHPISEENQFPGVYPSVQDQVLLSHPHKLLVQDHDFMMDEIERRELLNANEDIDGGLSDVGSDEDDDDDDDDDEDDDVTNKE